MSILNDTKKVLGIDSTVDAFDLDVTMHINDVFATLEQIGIGPAGGYRIEDATTDWSDYVTYTDSQKDLVKTYIFLKVKLVFDPPTTSFHLEAMKNQIKEHEWRLEITVPTPPTTT